MTTIAVLSDLHIAPPGPLASFHAGAELAGLLGRLRAKHDVDTLLLAGDIVDLLALPDSTATLDPATIPARLTDLFHEIGDTPWGAQVLGALGDLATAGVRVVVLPGNHDPELAHPEAMSILRKACGLDSDDRRIASHLGPGPWRHHCGPLEVVVGHGHRGDPWNDIDPAQVLHRSTTNPPLVMELPLGSRLVVGAMRAFRKTHAFVDALKPETPAVPLLLLYLDPVLAMQHLPGVANLSVRALVGGLKRRLVHGPTLGAASHQAAAPTDADRLSDALFDALAPEERTEATVSAIEDWLRGHTAPGSGTLATHGGAKFLLRAALRLLSGAGSFFDPTHLSDDDQAIVREHLPAGGGPRVVIAGHTHAARRVQLAHGDYINTGTWTDLIPWPSPASDADAKAFIDQLDAGQVRPLRRLTWALVDESGARLVTEPTET
ncbi:MAG: metallophosphoesterase [Kofleriaceae bacterium]|nr:metallophosphoesterase [Kofleriaceae bacterium]MBP9169535.1 metallophosphoesterase [Kofleriaceae bacterium]MBP9859180.1 metallophosphoesterase [Kofleriaceae bacterium]